MRIILNEVEQDLIDKLAVELSVSSHQIEVRLTNYYAANFDDDLEYLQVTFEEDKL